MSRIFKSCVLFLVIGVLILAGCGQTSKDQDQYSSSSIKLEGTIVDTNGKGIAQVLVSPTSLDDPPKNVPEIAIYTDEEGKFVWNLNPGKYTFKLQKKGLTEMNHAVVVGEAPTEQLRIVMKK